MRYTKKDILKIILGGSLVIVGTPLQIYDWWIYFGDVRNTDLRIISILISLSGSLILLKKLLKTDLAYIYGLFYPFLIMILYHVVFLFYIEPRISSQNNISTAKVIDVFENFKTDGGSIRAITYKYYANNTLYTKAMNSDDLKKGDTLNVKYFDLNPNFHLIETKK